MLALFDVGGTQLILILALILIFFGAKRIPDLAKGLGQGIKEFKKATREVSDEIHNSASDTPVRPATPQVSQPAPADKASVPSDAAHPKS
jgi:sec-independent protein translocase protein TatA